MFAIDEACSRVIILDIKEAYLKVIGKGLLVPSAMIEVLARRAPGRNQTPAAYSSVGLACRRYSNPSSEPPATSWG
jgi:hypothetical protein